MFKYFRHRLKHLNKSDLQEYTLKTYKSRRLPMVTGAWLVMFFELFMIISVLVKPGPVNASDSRLMYFRLYVILFAITLICFIIILCGKKYFQKNPSSFLDICVVYAFCICFWGAFLSAYSHRSTADISVFLYVCLSIAVLVPMNPVQIIALYASGWGFFMLMLGVYADPALDLFSSQLNSAFTFLLSIYISILLHRMRINDFINEKTILEQHARIKKMNEQLGMMITVDDLTQIYNRRFMNREFPLMLENARRQQLSVAMLMIDIDYFKQYNDLYGHQAGDKCLCRVASIVKDIINEENALFVRYGGEEFLILLIGMEPENVRALADEIRSGVERAAIPHEDSPEGVVAVSVGVCCSRGDGEASLNQLIRYADVAMYDAKSAGRNRVSVYLFTQPQDDVAYPE